MERVERENGEGRGEGFSIIGAFPFSKFRSNLWRRK